MNIGRASLLVCLCAAATLGHSAPAPGIGSRDWGDPVLLTGPTLGATGDLAYTSGGDLVAAWSEVPLGVRVAFRPNGGVFVPGEPLGLGDTPDVATDGRGGALVGWATDEGEVRVVERPADGTFGVPVALGEGSGPVQVATNLSGDAAVTWVRAEGDGPAQVWAAYRTDGGEFGAPEPVSTPMAGDFRPARRDVAVTVGGDAIVLWEEPVAEGLRQARAAMRPADGEFGLPVLLSEPGRQGLEPRVAAGDDTWTLMAWIDAEPGAESGYVRYRPLAGGQDLADEQAFTERVDESEDRASRLRLAMVGAENHFNIGYLKATGDPAKDFEVYVIQGYYFGEGGEDGYGGGTFAPAQPETFRDGECNAAARPATDLALASDPRGRVAMAWVHATGRPFLATHVQESGPGLIDPDQEVGSEETRATAPVVARERGERTAVMFVEEPLRVLRVMEDYRPPGIGCFSHPRIVVPPAVSGAVTAGETVVADPGQWAVDQQTPGGRRGARGSRQAAGADVSYAFQWERCSPDLTACFPVPGGTARELALGPVDIGWRLRVEVTARNRAGRSRAMSAPGATIRARPAAGVGPGGPGSSGGGSGAAGTRPALDLPASGLTVRPRGRTVALRLVCLEPGAAATQCQGTARAAMTARGRRIALGTRAFLVAPGESTVVRFRLSSRARSALRRARRARMTVSLLAVDGTGVTTRRSFRLWLRPR